MSKGIELNYQRKVPWHNRRSTRRLFFLAVGLLIAGATYKYWPRLRLNVPYLLAQHQCMTYAAPADQVVYQEGSTFDQVTITSDPKPWQKMEQWSAAAGKPGTPVNPAQDSVVFLHARRSPAGHQRLVVVQMRKFNNEVIDGTIINLQEIRLYTTAISPGSPVSPASWAAPFEMQIDRDPREALTLMAGQLDPNDESHFTIDCQIDGQSDIIDGWLGDNDIVKLSPRAVGELSGVGHSFIAWLIDQCRYKSIISAPATSLIAPGKLSAPEQNDSFPQRHQIAFSQHGNLFGVETTHGVRLWDTRSWHELPSLNERTHDPASGGAIAFSSDGSLIAEGGIACDGIRIVDLSTNKTVIPFKEGNFTDHGYPVCFSSNNSSLAILFQTEPGVAIWNFTGSHDQAGRVKLRYADETSLVLSSDLRLAAIKIKSMNFNVSNTIEIQQIASGMPAQSWRESNICLELSPDGGKLLTSGAGYWDPSSFAIFDVSTGKPIAIRCCSAARAGFSSTGKFFVTLDPHSSNCPHNVMLWDFPLANARWELDQGNDPPIDFAFSPDGNTIATLSARSSVRIWDIHDINK